MNYLFQTQRSYRLLAIALILIMTGPLLASLTHLTDSPPLIQAQEVDQLFINEFMASNGQTIADEDGDFEDWIELYNAGPTTISLAGYGLSDNPAQPFRWVFPEVSLASGDFLLVWASGKNRTLPGAPLHTNFSISAAGEPLLLTHPADGLVDQIGPLPVPRDISYGRQPDGSGAWYFFDQPTPGSSNSTPGYSEILDPPIFSHQGGFFTEAFSLTLSSSSPEADIIFTLDGSWPDIDNLDGRTYSFKNQFPENPGDPVGPLLSDSYQTYLYSQPLSIVDRSGQPDKLTQKSSTFHQNPTYFPTDPVFKATVVRAQLVSEDALPSPVQTHTFFVTPAGRDRYSLPVIAISLSEDAFFDHEDGIYTAGVDFEAWRAANPTAPLGCCVPANWQRMTEPAAHLEFFETGIEIPVFSQDIGVRVHGRSSRAFPFKSLRLYARSGYGLSDFAHPFFPDLPYTSYQRLLLRNSGGDYATTLLRDAAIQTLMSELPFDTQAYRPAVIFINGEYWGLLNMRERYDKHYLSRVYGVDPENIDLLEDNAVVKEGDAVHYQAMLDYITANGLQDNEHYEEILTRLDVQNYIDYYIAQIYMRNRDWPGDNINYWRNRTEQYEPEAPYGLDGRWRWMMFDTDSGFRQPNHDTLTAVSTGTHWSTFLFRSFLENETFTTDFINRFADLLNTLFLPENVTPVIDNLSQTIAPEIPEHIERWSHPTSVFAWNNNLNTMLNFANARPEFQRQHLLNRFALAGEFTLTVDLSGPEQGHVRVNTIELTEATPGVTAVPYPWSGIYFQEIPIELEAIPAPGYQFVGWTGLPAGTPALTVQTFTADTAVTALFEEATHTETVLLHYWHFNNLPSGTLNEIPVDYSLLGDATITYPGTGDGYMDRVNDGTLLNAQLDEPEGYALRVRNPSDTRELRLTLPTTGYEEIVLRYAAYRTNNGAETQTLYYRTSEAGDWIQFGEPLTISAVDYQLFTFDFSDVAGVADNEAFSVYILFGGDNAPGGSGNNRFDNISVEATPLDGTNVPPVVIAPVGLQQAAVGQSPVVIDLETVFADPDDDPLTFAAQSGDTAVLQTTLDASLLTLTGLYQGEAWVTVAADDGYNDPVSTTFRVLVYPPAYPLSEGPFTFGAWDPELPERVYPDYMLFLQSDVNDPPVDLPLLYPYYIPHDDYHADDSETIGFPYNNTGRTRLNGLGEDGIAFINTGRGRDLGGALVALNTEGMSDLTTDWLAQTLLQNSRLYGLRLQYRVGFESPFTDLLVDGQPVEYLAGPDGDWQQFEQIPLPAEAMDQPYVQVMWRYYHVSGDGGPRAQLRLDDIVIRDSVVHAPIQTAVLEAPFVTGQFYPFAGTINCGGVTFTDVGIVNTILITLTHQFPTANFDGLPRYYDIEADGDGYDVELQLCFTDNDLQAAGILPEEVADLRAFRWDGIEWELHEEGVVDEVAQTVTAENVTQFSIWGLGTPDNRPTSVTLTTFGLAQAHGNSLLLLLFTTLLLLGTLGWIARRRIGI